MERPARIVRPYLAIVSSVPRLYLAYRAWAWMEFIVQIIALTVFVFFWRAIYAGRSSLGGLTQAQTINYILLAQVMAPVVMESLVFTFGGLLRQGELAVELLRPMDLQARFYVEQVSSLGLSLVLKIPLAVIAWLRSRDDPILDWIPSGVTNHSKVSSDGISRRSWWAHRTSREITGTMCGAAQVSRNEDRSSRMLSPGPRCSLGAA
jgi:hypothetical protein